MFDLKIAVWDQSPQLKTTLPVHWLLSGECTQTNHRFTIYSKHTVYNPNIISRNKIFINFA